MANRTIDLTDRLYDYLVSVSVREPPLLAELRLVPLALRLPLCPPGGVVLPIAVGGGRSYVAVRVARPPDHAIADMPLRHIDLLPALRAKAFVAGAGAMHPGEQVLGSRPEGTEDLKTGKSVHRLPPGPECDGPGRQVRDRCHAKIAPVQAFGLCAGQKHGPFGHDLTAVEMRERLAIGLGVDRAIRLAVDEECALHATDLFPSDGGHGFE